MNIDWEKKLPMMIKHRSRFAGTTKDLNDGTVKKRIEFIRAHTGVGSKSLWEEKNLPTSKSDFTIQLNDFTTLTDISINHSLAG